MDFVTSMLRRYWKLETTEYRSLKGGFDALDVTLTRLEPSESMLLQVKLDMQF